MSSHQYDHISSYKITDRTDSNNPIASGGYMYLADYTYTNSDGVHVTQSVFSKNPIYMSDKDIKKYNVRDQRNKFFNIDDDDDDDDDDDIEKRYSIRGSEYMYKFINLTLTGVMQDDDDEPMYLFSSNDIIGVNKDNLNITVAEEKHSLTCNFIHRYKYYDFRGKKNIENYRYVGTIKYVNTIKAIKTEFQRHLFKNTETQDRFRKYVETDINDPDVYSSASPDEKLSDDHTGITNIQTNKPITVRNTVSVSLLGGKYGGKRSKPKTKQTKTKQNKTKQNKTKQNKTKQKRRR